MSVIESCAPADVRPAPDEYAIFIENSTPPRLTLGATARVYASSDTVVVRWRGGEFRADPGARIEFDGPAAFGSPRLSVAMLPLLLAAAAEQRVKVRRYRPKAKDRGLARRRRRYHKTIQQTWNEETR